MIIIFNIAFPEDQRDELVVLAKTAAIPRQIVIVRAGIDPDILGAIKETLITAHESEGGQLALDAFQTSRFDEFPEGIEIATENIRKMLAIVQGLPLP